MDLPLPRHPLRDPGFQRPQGLPGLQPLPPEPRGGGGYGLAFYFLSLSLKTVPLSLAYAVWAGVGTAAIALIGAFFFGEAISPKGWLGIALVAVGVVLIRLAD